MRFEEFEIRKGQEVLSVHPMNVAYIREHVGTEGKTCTLVFTGGAERKLDIGRREAQSRLHRALHEMPPELAEVPGRSSEGAQEAAERVGGTTTAANAAQGSGAAASAADAKRQGGKATAGLRSAN